MSDSVRERDPEKARAVEQLRHHGIVVSDASMVPAAGDENLDDTVTTSATQMLEWLRKSPGWITSKR
jgi:hypothetical protein